MTEEQTDFPIVMRGYDRVQVDLQIQTLMTALAEARREVETLDARNATLAGDLSEACLLYTSPSPRDLSTSRMPSSA